eukprot:2475233-Prymnesium_polylepis.2
MLYAARTTLNVLPGWSIPTPSVYVRLSAPSPCAPWLALSKSWFSSAAISSDPWIAVEAVLNARSRSAVSGSGFSGTSSPRIHEWESSWLAVIRFL